MIQYTHSAEVIQPAGATRSPLGHFEVHMDKLQHDTMPSLCVRYTSTKHAVPDIREVRVGAGFVNALHKCLGEYSGKGALSTPFINDLHLEKIPSHDAELLLHLLHRSHTLLGGDPRERRKALSRKYDNYQSRLSTILAEIDAGNDNMELKKEGLRLADILKRTKRITHTSFADIVKHLQDPK